LKPSAGKVPDEFEELLKLPGVGRKTANLVLAVAFGQERCKPVATQCDCCLFEQNCPKNGIIPRLLPTGERIKSKKQQVKHAKAG
jgi:endonuclease III